VEIAIEIGRLSSLPELFHSRVTLAFQGRRFTIRKAWDNKLS
jgi:hypothetical protein